MTDLPEHHLSDRTILRPGDLVRIDSGKARYTVQRIVQTSTGVEVHVYGGRQGFLSARVFQADQVTRCRSKNDPNEGLRQALHEVSVRSKARRR